MNLVYVCAVKVIHFILQAEIMSLNVSSRAVARVTGVPYKLTPDEYSIAVKQVTVFLWFWECWHRFHKHGINGFTCAYPIDCIQFNTLLCNQVSNAISPVLTTVCDLAGILLAEFCNKTFWSYVY